MEDLNERKLIEEIKNLQTERKANYLKGLALLIGSIVLFIAIQRPESILNRKLSEETISRERAKLIIELTQNIKKPEEVIFGLSIIEKAYPAENSQWVNEIKALYDTKLQAEINKLRIKGVDSLYNAKLYRLRNELDELLKTKELFQYALIAEVDGNSGSGKRGIGPNAVKLSNMIQNTQSKIDSLKLLISKTGLDKEKKYN